MTAVANNVTTIANLQSEVAQHKLAAENAINLANYFATAQMKIDDRIANTSFKGNVKNTIVWIISNRKEVYALIQYIIAVVKEVKDKIQEVTQRVNDAKANA